MADDHNRAFNWVGLNSQGKRDEGVLHATDAREAQAELKKRGIEIISIKPKLTFNFNLSISQPTIKFKDILLFTRYLSTMLSAGLPIIQALDIIAKDQENPTMQSLITSIKNDIAGGKTLAETFSQHPNYFNDLYCNLIKSGEKSGTLDKILNRLAGYLEKTETLKRKIKKAFTYPIAILSIAFIVSGILLIFVVPQFQKMFSSFGAELPFFTRMVVNLSNFLRNYWWAIILVIGGLIVGWRYSWRQNAAVKHYLDRGILKIYVVGDIMKKGIIARFTRTLSTTVEAGMPLVESMRSMAGIMGNSIYTKAVLNMCEEVSNGHTLSASMGATKLFPTMTIQMIAIGETSGRLAEMLNKIADYYEEEVNNIVDTLSSLLEPLIMVILGVIIGTFVVAMYLPIFKIGSLF